MLRGVLLDIDGTLLFSNDAHAQAWVDAFAAFGYQVDLDRVQALIGMGGDRLMAAVAPGLTPEEGQGKKISEHRKQIFLEVYAPMLRPTPGARTLVAALRDAGLQVTIATSAKSDELGTLLRAADIQDLVQEETTADDAASSKPAPDIVEAALQKSGMSAEDAVMVGDTPYDIESGSRARVPVIAVRTGGHTDTALADAIAVYDTPGQLAADLQRQSLQQLVENRLTAEEN